MEVPQQPRADFVSPSARRRTGSHTDDLLHVLEEELVDVVKPALNERTMVGRATALIHGSIGQHS